jgi:outer membrane protein assembly factor BamB
VRDGIAYALSASGAIAVETNSGKTIWWRDYGGTPQMAPAVDERKLYVQLGAHQMAAIDRMTGEIVWRFDDGTSGDLDPSPTLFENRLFFGLTKTNAFYCVDTEGGRLIWRTPIAGTPTYVAPVSDGVVVVGAEKQDSSGVHFFGLNAETGTVIWESQQRESSSSASVLDGRVVIGGGDFRARALDLRSGQEVWSSPVEDKFDPRNMPALAFGDVFLADRVGNVYRLDGKTGRRKWLYRDTVGTMDQSFPVIAGRTLFIGSGAGWLYAIDTEEGKLLWKDRVRGIVLSGAADAERFYFGVKLGPDEGLHAYEHDPEGKLETGNSRVETLPALLGGLLLFALVFGGVFLFARRRRGRLNRSS